FVLWLALVPPAWLETARARIAVTGFTVFFSVMFASQSYGFQSEAARVLRLLDRVPPKKVMVAVAFGNRSRYFGRNFRITHFLPLYYTTLHGGVDRQFWGRYTPHLPIDYRPGKIPLPAVDWTPEAFNPEVHLRGADYAFLQLSTSQTVVGLARVMKG